MPKQRTREEMAAYQAERRQRLQQPEKPPKPLPPELETKLHRQRVAPRPAVDEFGDGLPPTSTLIAQMDQAGRDAILEGIRTGSPEPWREYLRTRTQR